MTFHSPGFCANKMFRKIKMLNKMLVVVILSSLLSRGTYTKFIWCIFWILSSTSKILSCVNLLLPWDGKDTLEYNTCLGYNICWYMYICVITCAIVWTRLSFMVFVHIYQRNSKTKRKHQESSKGFALVKLHDIFSIFLP